MHDWTLKSVNLDWKTARATFLMRNEHSNDVQLIAESVVDLRVPHADEWGPSVSVNKIEGPSQIDQALKKMTIEMQSGDRIEVVAKDFIMPAQPRK